MMEEPPSREPRAAVRGAPRAQQPDDATLLLNAFLEERVRPHPILGPALARATACATGPVSFGAWDENSPLEAQLILRDEEHRRTAGELKAARLWHPGRDARVCLRDREPFRRFPGVEITLLSATQLERQFLFDLPVTLWLYSHASVSRDGDGLLESAVRAAAARFRERLSDLRCERYYCFRSARNDLTPPLVPGRLSTLLAIKRGETVREALRLAFLADGLPYPPDTWLEWMAERETAHGATIVAAVRALLTARETHTIDRASKVLRDRVVLALQQGGVSESWLEQWWLWPSVAPLPRDAV